MSPAPIPVHGPFFLAVLVAVPAVALASVPFLRARSRWRRAPDPPTARPARE